MKPLRASARYVVTNDRKVTDVTLMQESSNPVFNTLVTGVIKSMSNEPVLQFPPGSKRLRVEMSATFSQNYGIGDFDLPGEIDWDPRRSQMHPAKYLYGGHKAVDDFVHGKSGHLPGYDPAMSF